MKYLRIALIKEVKDLYAENFINMPLMKEMEKATKYMEKNPMFICGKN